MKKHENIKFLAAMLASKLFLLLFPSCKKYPFNHLTGERFQTMMVKNCSVNVPMNTKSKRNLILCPYWEVENEIIVFLINEGFN